MDSNNVNNSGTDEIENFWDNVSDDDEEIFDNSVAVEPKSISAIEMPKDKQQCHTDVSTSRCSSFKSDRGLTPLDIDLPTSFENSPSISVSNFVVGQVNIATPMPSPTPCNCRNICKGEFCIEHDKHNSITVVTDQITPISRKRHGYQNILRENVKRRCVRNIARTFSPSQRSHSHKLPQSDATPSPSITPVSSPCGHNGKDSDYNAEEDIDSDKENDSSNDTDGNESLDPSPRGAKKMLKGRNEWLQTKRKLLKNLGQEYTTKTGKLIPKKNMKPPCRCRFKCYEKIDNTERDIVFQKFWQLGDRQKQWSYVIKYVKKEKKKRTLNRDTPNSRQFTFKYFLPLADQSNDTQVSTIDVCKTMFINTLAISDKLIRTAWEKYDGSTEVEADKRGRHKNHRRVITEDMIRGVVDHVNSLVPIESHYLRKKTKKLYLEDSPSTSRLFQLYNEWFDSEKYTTKALTLRQYREIVKKNFNLGKFIPKKDQCNVCHAFKTNKNPTEQKIIAQNQHQENKILARDKKEKDKTAAIASEGKILTAVFDFEKILNCPHANVSLLYYKRKLSCLNFTVFDMGTKKAICYMWDETVAKRGSNEVSSCLLDYIESHIEKGVEEFRFWSDNCTGQNRNRIVFSLYVYAAHKYNINISHSFLEKGHTQNEGDSVHSTIEKASAVKTIYTPEEWKLLVRWAKAPDHEPYSVKSVTQDSIFDFKSQINDRLWMNNSQGKKISWINVREVAVTKDEPFILKYKYNFNYDYEFISLKNRTRQQSSTAFIDLKKAYNGLLPITKAKKKDLMSLCNEGIIPADYLQFFEQLPTNTADNNIVPDRVFTDDESSDEEEESSDEEGDE